MCEFLLRLCIAILLVYSLSYVNVTKDTGERKACRRNVRWFLSSGTVRHEVDVCFFLIIVCCCLLLYTLTAISIVAFMNNRNILSLSCPLYADSTIRPAETGSLEWVVQKQQHLKVLVVVSNIGESCVVRAEYSLSVSVSAP